MRVVFAATVALGGFLACAMPVKADAASALVLSRPQQTAIAPGAQLDHVYWVWRGRHYAYRWRGGYYMHRRWARWHYVYW